MAAKRLAALALAMTLLATCSGSGRPEVTMAEYTVEAPSDVEAGSVTLGVRNLGAITHSLAVLQTRRDPGELPVEDAEVQTDAPGIREIGSTDEIAAGDEATLSVRLRPGRYALICNVPGHYQSGMYAGLRVV